MQAKTREAKRLAGTLNSTRDKKQKALTAVVIANQVPEPHSILSSRERELYYLVAERIRATMPLLPLDGFSLQQLAVALAMAEHAHGEIRANGYVQTYKTGARALAPEVLLYEKAIIMITKISSLFGMTPKDRVALLGTIAPEPDKPDPTDGL